MLNTKNQRLNFFFKSLHIKTSEFATELGTSQPTISLILSGKRNLSRGMVARIKQSYPKLNVGWLLTGEGDMVLDSARGSVSQYIGRDGNAYNDSIVNPEEISDNEEVEVIELNENYSSKDLMREIHRLKALLFDKEEELKKVKSELNESKKKLKAQKK